MPAGGTSTEPLTGWGPGRPPDRAYFLLLGTCVAAYLLVTGTILTYLSFSQYPQLQYDEVRHFYHLPTRAVGPVFAGIGSIMLLLIIITACVFGCEQRIDINTRRVYWKDEEHGDEETEILKDSTNWY